MNERRTDAVALIEEASDILKNVPSPYCDMVLGFIQGLDRVLLMFEQGTEDQMIHALKLLRSDGWKSLEETLKP